MCCRFSWCPAVRYVRNSHHSHRGTSQEARQLFPSFLSCFSTVFVCSNDEAGSQQGAAGSVGAQQSDTSETGSTVTEEPVWKPDSCFPAFKSMMEEQDLNIKLVTVKQDVSEILVTVNQFIFISILFSRLW